MGCRSSRSSASSSSGSGSAFRVGLAKVCRELVSIGADTQHRAEAIAKPHTAVRIIVYVAIAAGVIGLVTVALVFTQSVQLQMGNEVFGLFQGIEAAMNITVLTGAALFFLVTPRNPHQAASGVGRPARLPLDRARHRHASIDQGSERPARSHHADRLVAGAHHGPIRLMRYLDYCSEMLSLTNKLAALYAQNLPDSVVIDTVNDIEELTTNLSSKIWQKISILESHEVAVPSAEVRPPDRRNNPP